MKKLVFIVFLLLAVLAGFSQTTIVNGLQVKGLQGSPSGQVAPNKSGLAVVDSTGKVMKLSTLAAIGARVRQVNKISDTVLQFVTDSAVYTLLVRGGLSPFRQAKLDSLIAGLLYDSTYVSNAGPGTTQLVYISANGDTVKAKSIKNGTVVPTTNADSSVTLNVAASGVTAGIYGSSSQGVILNVGIDGRINAIAPVSISGTGGSLVRKTPVIITANYTLQASDSNTYLVSTSTSPLTVTVPTTASSGLPLSYITLDIYQLGTGKITVVPASTVAVASGTGITTRTSGLNTRISISQVSNNEWIGSGGLDTTTAPSESTSVSSLSGFVSNSGSVSPSQSFTLFGSGLTSNVVLTAPTNFEISTDNATFTATVTIVPSSGTIPGQLIYNRIKNSAPLGVVSGNVTSSGGGVASNPSVALSGTVANNTAVVTVSPGTLTGLNTTGGVSGTAQTLAVTFANITGSVTATAPNTSFEVSQDNITFAPSQSFSSGSPVTLYVRATSSAPAGAISGTMTVAAIGVTTQNVSLSGTVGAGSKDSVKFAFSLTNHTVPSGYTKVFGDPSTGVRTASGGVLNSITISSVATNHWSALSGSSAYDIDGLLGSTVPGIPDSLLQRGWYMYSAVPGGLQSDSATLGLSINQLLIGGLNPAATYTISWSASLDASRFGLVCQNKLRIQGITMYISPLLQESNNTSQPTTPQFTSVQPDASGNLKVYIFTEAASELAILAALTIKQN